MKPGIVIQAHPSPTGYLMRQLHTSLGVEHRARSAAKAMGWDGKSAMTYCDSDGLPLGGFVPTNK